jgi:cellobiose phosphorylase
MKKRVLHGFSDDGLEYHIHDPQPGHRDWFDFFWNERHLASAGISLNGFSLYQSEAGVVTNLFGKQDMREDPRWLYLRDRDTGRFWSAGFHPCLTPHRDFLCRHGLGYTILETEHEGIRTTFRLFVPADLTGEIWTVSVENRSGRPRRLSVFPVASILLDGVNMPYGYFGGLTAEYFARDRMIFFRNMTRTVVEERYRGFMYSDRPPARTDCSKDHFLGRYRSFARPERIVEGRLGNSPASAEHMVGAMQFDVGLKPGASWRANLVLGIVFDRREARAAARRFRDAAAVERAFEKARQTCVGRVLGGLQLDTPDERLNRLMNVWLKHELYLMADWARFYFKGYRDTCQDAAGLSVIDPVRAHLMLHKALRNQRSDGFCPRAFRVPSMDVAAADKHYADSPSWISHATHALLRETGDLALLDEVVPYFDQGEGTVWDHNLRALEFLWNDRGAHGLSLIHYGDWNDLIDHAGPEGKGEGVWMSMALARVLRLTEEMAGWRGDAALAEQCRRRHAELCENIRRHGWDQDRFIYAINDAGRPIGSRKAREGRIFINPQSWALLGGIVTAAEYERIARKIEPIVDTPVGPVHCWPPFTTYDPGIGQLTGTPAGFFTNGNVYCHAASFKIAADFEAGRHDKAYDTLCRILPSADKSEPYVQANGYVGPTALRLLRHVSDDPWRTGTVAWHFLNVVDRMLGFERTLEGFRLRPRIPSAWTGARYRRPFRGRVFEVEIERGGEPGMWVDGVRVEGDFVAVPKDGPRRRRPVRVRCVIGA